MDSFMNAQTERAGALMKDFVDTVLSFYQNMRRQDVCRQASAETISRLQGMGIPQKGRPVDEVFREMTDSVYSNATLVQHPRCFACIPSPVSLFSWMGDVMTNACLLYTSDAADEP